MVNVQASRNVNSTFKMLCFLNGFDYKCATITPQKNFAFDIAFFDGDEFMFCRAIKTSSTQHGNN